MFSASDWSELFRFHTPGRRLLAGVLGRLIGWVLRCSALRAAEADLTLSRVLCTLLKCGDVSGICLWRGLQFPAWSGALVTSRAKSVSLKANIYFIPSLYSTFESQSSKFKVEKSHEVT